MIQALRESRKEYEELLGEKMTLEDVYDLEEDFHEGQDELEE